ncbi:hypothetical protein [Candidatus Venteria ishoeyi]|uniref:Uncharacterized protein n=1 Tax=Candidatus Venteria ishoeyi TaxID=1899563 RepID=A0A1H6F2H3_9GAMM|nr:hypothetical protein [Candidatus Venteria ishoeyi]SEH04320.1 Uncharacterised protein [Candidatus Venteria ishoeyi]
MNALIYQQLTQQVERHITYMVQQADKFQKNPKAQEYYHIQAIGVYQFWFNLISFHFEELAYGSQDNLHLLSLMIPFVREEDLETDKNQLPLKLLHNQNTGGVA